MDATEFLQGDPWLGHPVHPLLVAGPIGMWILSLVMDGMATITRSECAQEAADYALTAGLVGAGLSAVTGLAEYTRVPHAELAQKEAFTHGALNAGTTALFGVNAALRARSKRGGRRVGLLPKLMTLAGVGVLGYTGWLGGNLAYKHGVGVHLDQALAERQGEKEAVQEQAPAEGRRRTREPKVTS